MATRPPPAPDLTLDLTELAEWHGLADLASVRSLVITSEGDAHDTSALEPFLAAEHLRALSALVIDIDAPLPERVWKAVAQHRVLVHLTLVGRCATDVALRVLAESKAKFELRSLRVMFGRISEAGIDVLVRAPFAKRIEQLWLWASGLGPTALSKLCEGAWASLRELDVSYRHIPESIAEIEQRFGALEALTNAVGDSAPPTRTQEALERRLEETLASRRTVASRAMLSLVDDIDDEQFASRYLERCKLATKASRDEVDLFDVPIGRPQARVCSSVVFTLPANRERLSTMSEAFDASHVGVYCDEASNLDEVNWVKLFPALESLRLGPCPRAWNALSRVVPPVRELDLSASAWLWLNEGDDLHRLMQFLSTQPTIRRVLLGAGWWTDRAYRSEVEWVLGASRIVDGWLERA